MWKPLNAVEKAVVNVGKRVNTAKSYPHFPHHQVWKMWIQSIGSSIINTDLVDRRGKFYLRRSIFCHRIYIYRTIWAKGKRLSGRR